MLTMSKPNDMLGSLSNSLIFIACMCSLATIVIFFLFYNFDVKALKNRGLKIIVGVIVIIGTLVHAYQIFMGGGLIITPYILLIYDFYIIHKIMRLYIQKHKSA